MLYLLSPPPSQFGDEANVADGPDGERGECGERGVDGGLKETGLK